jgi:apolipoprotein N-acyltransferase
VPAAVLSGVLTALAFPKFGFSFLAWFSLIPLLWEISRKPSKSGFIRGFLAGLFFYGILLYWIPDVPAHYGGMPYWLCLLVYLALIGYLALYWGIFGAVFSRIRRAFPGAAFALAPLIWIGCEFAMTHALTGFPWGILGTSQFKNLYLLQTASLAGVYGISFLLLSLQSAFVLALTRKKRSPFFAVLALLLLAHSWGFFVLKRGLGDDAPSFKVSVIQGNVSSDVYWTSVSDEAVKGLFDEHMELTSLGALDGARLIVWPEFTVPLCFSCDESLYQELRAALETYVRTSGTTLILGTNERAGTPVQPLYFNTAMCLHPDLSRTHYAKMHLVPFGEYTPFKKIFFFIERLTHAIGEITPGSAPVLHRYRGYGFGSPICYEIIFPGIARTFVRKGADFLVTITNDGWYGNSSAPYQHWAQAVVRAVETRRFLVRAATTGISGFVDPFGKILAQSEIGTRAVLTGTVVPVRTLSLYARTGDVLPWIGLTMGALFLILASLKTRKGPAKNVRVRKIV